MGLETWNSRIKRCAELMSPIPIEDIEGAAEAFSHKLHASSLYEPSFKLKGDVVFLRAQDSFVELGEDYDLRKVIFSFCLACLKFTGMTLSFHKDEPHAHLFDCLLLFFPRENLSLYHSI